MKNIIFLSVFLFVFLIISFIILFNNKELKSCRSSICLEKYDGFNPSSCTKCSGIRYGKYLHMNGVGN